MILFHRGLYRCHILLAIHVCVQCEVALVIVADPLMIDQAPVPTVGVFAAMVKVEVLHRV